jgi:hypothetical protein
MRGFEKNTQQQLAKKLVAGCCLLTFMSSAVCAEAPNELRGKSFIVHWREARKQQVEPMPVRSVTATGTFAAYFSDAGKTFSRLTFAVPNRKGVVKSGNNEKVSGETSGRELQFNGNDANITWERGEGGATKIDVHFDEKFEHCTAKVVTGKTGGADRIRAKSIIDGSTVQIFSAIDSEESCKVQNGNVFGG